MGFTAITERLQPEQITLLLNEYLTEMSGIALKQAPPSTSSSVSDRDVFRRSRDRAPWRTRACVNMAMEMQRRLAELSANGVGVSNSRSASASASIPAIATSEISAALIGWTNDHRRRGKLRRAAPIDRRARTWLISYETYAHLRDIVAARALPEITVKGISRAVVPYVVEGVLDEAGRKIEIFSEHMTGLDFYLDPRAVDGGAIEHSGDAQKGDCCPRRA